MLLLRPIVIMIVNMFMILTLRRDVLAIMILILRLTQSQPNATHLRVHGNHISNVVNAIKLKANNRRGSNVYRQRPYFQRTRRINNVGYHLRGKSSL